MSSTQRWESSQNLKSANAPTVTYTLEEIRALEAVESALTPEQIAAIPDGDIDLSEMPELDTSFFAEADLMTPKPVKEMVTLRLDPDVLAYFRQPGPGYQTRINTVLRLWIKAHPNPAKGSRGAQTARQAKSADESGTN